MIDREVWKKAWALLDPHEKRQALIVLVVVIISSISSVAMIGSIMPFLAVLSDTSQIESTPTLAWAYRYFDVESRFDFLILLGIASMFVIIAASVAQIVRVYVVAQFALMRVHSLSQRLLAAYLRQPYQFFLSRHSSEMGTRIQVETHQVVDQFFRPAAEVVATLLTTIAIVALLLWVDPIVTLFAFATFGGLYWGIFAVVRTYLKRLGQTRVDANNASFKIATEALGGIKTLKLLGREEDYVVRYGFEARRMARALVFVQVISHVPPLTMHAISFGGIILLCLFLIDPAGLDSGATLGGILPLLGVFAFAGQRLMPELSKLYVSLSLLQSGGASVLTIYKDLVGNTRSATLPKATTKALGMKREFRMHNVSYNYPNSDAAGIRDISLTICSGEKIGIVGSTGAGKTSIVDIILCLLPPSEGKLSVDGTDLTEDMIRAWQKSVAYVPQDIFLTDSSITENIAFGTPKGEIDQSRIIRAAHISRLDRFIREELPDGYDTIVGERGVRLSGGQRQRIGIARALYHDADLIIFDEATSALDNVTEAEVIAAIDDLPGDKTIVMIAHRLSTVRRCDRIIVLDQGRIVGFDNWATLIADNSTFQNFAKLVEVK